MTVKYRSDDKPNLDRVPTLSRREAWRLRRAALARSTSPPPLPCRRGRPPNAATSVERPAQRLRRILTSCPRARHFTIRRIVAALGDAPEGPTVALFSASGAFEVHDIGYLSGVMTGAVGVQLALQRGTVPLPRALLRRKIPRHALASVIRAVSNLLRAPRRSFDRDGTGFFIR